ncbi:uricase [Infundibulicybe gibba]|nr:uricase [Infundibulicybe gibba]
MSAPGILSSARYGKDKIRVLRVVREGDLHHVVEYYVTALLEGEIDISYTQADNSVIVATDSIKNITYYLAKTSPYVLSPERFALHLGTHLVAKYAHIHKAFVTVEQLRWSRIPVPGSPAANSENGHKHSFYRDGDDKRIVKVEVDGSAGKDKLVGKVSSGISDLLVLKSTGSSFSGFIRDEYTILAEVDDRIFSTSVDLTYTFAPANITLLGGDKEGSKGFEIAKGDGGIWDEEVPVRARLATLEVFAEDESASVQATLYKMAQRLLAENSGIEAVTYSLPNKHFIPVDMRYIGLDNLVGTQAEVFMPISAPSGLISATVTRHAA